MKATALVILAALTPLADPSERASIATTQAKELVIEYLNRPASFGRVYTSPMRGREADLVCGLVQVRNEEVLFRPFIADLASRRVAIDNYTLHFSNIWERYCYPYPSLHGSN